MEFLGRLLVGIIRIYEILIIVRIFLSWFPLPNHTLIDLLHQITDPILEFFKRICPLKIGFFDLSPMIPLLLLGLSDTIIDALLIKGAVLSLGFFLGIFLYIAKFFINIFSFVISFACIILLIADLFFPHTYHPFITMIKSFLDPVLSKMRRWIKIRSPYADRIHYLILFLGITVLSSFCNMGLNLLAILLRSI